jgi:hypothetical protein
MGIVVESDDRGPKARAVGVWTSTDAAVLRESGVRRLEIGNGYGAPTFPFKEGLDDLLDLKVNHLALRSDADVATLPNLRRLSLETYSNDPIDFRVFQRLERLHVNWRQGAESAFEVSSLRSLSVVGYPFANLEPLAGLRLLEGLRLSSPARLSGLEGQAHLGQLHVLWLLEARALANLDGLEASARSLKELWLNGCRKVADISPVHRHGDLRRLALIDCGRIASLAPLAGLAKLEELYFYGTTIIDDGDMAPLLRMPALRRVAFAARRQYSLQSEDIERALGSPESEPMPHWRW